ncbi:hypothetical protein D3C80_1094230 [compost metagenome]
MLRVAASMALWVSSGVARPSTSPVDRMTKANSPAGPRMSAVSMADRAPSPQARARRKMIRAFSRIRPPARPRTVAGSAATASRSRLMPTPMKKTPSSRPLNGSIATSTSRRNSVSASRTPATRAPRLIDRPTAWAVRPAATTTRSEAATNSSRPSPRCWARATERNMGRRTRRPSSTIRKRPPAAGARVKRARPSSAGSTEGPLWARVARTVTVISMGATATS